MDARALATQLAYGRMAIGAGLVLAPRLFSGLWAGREALAGGGRVLSVALGARDVALGAGTLRALQAGGPAREWLLAGALADGGDLLGTLALRRSLPPTGFPGVALLAAGGVAAGLWAASQPTP